MWFGGWTMGAADLHGRLALILRLVIAARVIEDVDARVDAAALAIGHRFGGIEPEDTLEGACPKQRRILRDDAVAALIAAGY
jgi:hypothetical protein